MRNSDFRLFVICAVILVAILGFWWYILSSHRAMSASVIQLEAGMATMRQHVLTSERVLKALETLKAEVHNAREATEEQLERASALDGDARLDELVRLLNEDRTRRHSAGSACEPDGAGR